MSHRPTSHSKSRALRCDVGCHLRDRRGSSPIETIFNKPLASKFSAEQKGGAPPEPGPLLRGEGTVAREESQNVNGRLVWGVRFKVPEG